MVEHVGGGHVSLTWVLVRIVEVVKVLGVEVVVIFRGMLNVAGVEAPFICSSKDGDEEEDEVDEEEGDEEGLKFVVNGVSRGGRGDGFGQSSLRIVN